MTAHPMRIVAHRGASHDHPENTLAAFAGAVAQGADGVELDVRLLIDGGLAVHHDPELGDGRAVAALATAELPGHIPVLTDALVACGGLEVNVEIKNLPIEAHYDPAARVARVVAETLARPDRPEVLVSCFDPHTLTCFREVAPEVPTGFLLATAELLDAAIELTAGGGHVALHPWDGLVDADLVSRCHDRGIAVNVWTVDDPDRIRRLASWGVDAVITNRPAAARTALATG